MHTSKENTTGKLHVMNAHSLMAFATSSNRSLVQKVFPLRQEYRTCELCNPSDNSKGVKSNGGSYWVTIGDPARPSQQSISSCRQP
eukprot:2720222-Prymnesium_polylepis.2